VTGNYNGRGDSAGTLSSTGTNSVTLADADINKFFRGDIVEGTDANTGSVVKVSSDGKTLTLNNTLTGTGMQLAATEEAGLINSTTSGTPVADGTTNVPY